ncbi:MAG: hypothetical protein C0403_18040 [Desulfobacterium sp.]|nr:hypothetical protein [Desulfobacterium sp.]
MSKNPTFANVKDSQQNHFIDIMSTQNDRKILDEVLEIMWLHIYLIFTERTCYDWSTLGGFVTRNPHQLIGHGPKPQRWKNRTTGLL